VGVNWGGSGGGGTGVVCTLRARDADDGDNARLTYQLVSDHSADPVHFDLDPVSGQLRLVAKQLLVCTSTVSR